MLQQALLEGELHCHLADPSVSSRIHIAKRTRVEIACGLVERYPVESVKELHADLDRSSLFNACQLMQRQIRIIRSGPKEEPAGCCPKSA